MPANVKKLEAQIRTLARQRIASLFEHDGRADFVKDLALGYPLHVIMQILGVPPEDEARMLRLTQEIFGTLDPETLRTVSDSIHGLQAGGRTVGIVTHVEELKEEFTDRIMVNKRDGTSVVEIESSA